MDYTPCRMCLRNLVPPPQDCDDCINYEIWGMDGYKCPCKKLITILCDTCLLEIQYKRKRGRDVDQEVSESCGRKRAQR